jgi:hypothetical protein
VQSSEYILQSKLDDAWIAALPNQSVRAADVGRDVAESADVQRGGRNAEINPVGKIKCIFPELQRLLFPDPECSGQGDVKLEDAGTFNVIQAKGAGGHARCGINERGTRDPAIWALIADIWIADLIRPLSAFSVERRIDAARYGEELSRF